MRLTVRHAPGHTPGSVAFSLAGADEPLFFSGDLLFAGSIGRVDLPGGSEAAMLDSLARVVLPLDDATIVMAWRSEQHGIDAAIRGFQVIMSPQQRTYFDWAQSDEPDESEVLKELLHRNFHVQAYRMLLESSAAEQGARMTAMDGATRNAGELIKKLTVYYNKTRQAAITKELMDIVGGAEALK